MALGAGQCVFVLGSERVCGNERPTRPSQGEAQGAPHGPGRSPLVETDDPHRIQWLIEEKNCPANSETWAAAIDDGRAVEAYLLSLGADQLGWAERVFKDGSWVDPTDA